MECELCKIKIPPDFVNKLCDDCYKRLEEENQRIQEVDKEEKDIDTVIVSTEELVNNIEPPQTKKRDSSILDENYEENPEKEDKAQWEANFHCFIKTGVFLWHPTRDMYTFIKDYCMTKVLEHPQYPKYIWRPKIVDVGCGTGCGSNILSQEADFVWGLDKNEKSVQLAQQLFTRQKNGIYYSSECKFDNVDFVSDTRTFMKFDVVVAIEIIEHIDDWRTFVSNMIKHFDNGGKDVKGHEAPRTEYFISTPNRNNKTIRKDKPYNPFHVREYTAKEFLLALGTFFNNIEFFNSKGEPIPKEEYETTTHTPLLAKCHTPKI